MSATQPVTDDEVGSDGARLPVIPDREPAIAGRCAAHESVRLLVRGARELIIDTLSLPMIFDAGWHLRANCAAQRRNLKLDPARGR